MASNFKIGSIPTVMYTLDSLGLPNPHPVTFTKFGQIYYDGTGKPRGDGFASATWHFDLLTHEQLQYFMTKLVGQQGCNIAITTRTDYGSTYANQFVTFEGFLERPVFGDDYDIEMGRRYYTDVTFKFSFLQEVVP